MFSNTPTFSATLPNLRRPNILFNVTKYSRPRYSPPLERSMWWLVSTNSIISKFILPSKWHPAHFLQFSFPTSLLALGVPKIFYVILPLGACPSLKILHIPIQYGSETRSCKVASIFGGHIAADATMNGD